MAPNSLDSDFLFHMRPRDTRAMQAPDQERQQNLEKWYKDRLGTAKEAGIITGFFHNAVDEQAQRNSASEGAMFHAAGAQAEAGNIVPVVDRVFPLEKAAEAFAYLEAGHAAGKVVIEIA